MPAWSRVRRDKNVPNERPTGAEEDPARLSRTQTGTHIGGYDRSPVPVCHQRRELIVDTYMSAGVSIFETAPWLI